MNSDTVKLEHFEMGYFVDQNEDMPFDKVQHQNFTLTPNALSLGTASKSNLVKNRAKKNTNKTPLTIYLHHPYAYHNRAVELYEVVNGKLVRERILNMDDKATQQWMYRGSAIFDVILPPQQQKKRYL